MTEKRFNKDLWIMDMIRRGYVRVERDGTIWRRKFVGKDGALSVEFVKVKPRIHKATGRVYANFSWRGISKSVLINRMVALAFLPNPQHLAQVNHKDGDKENNAVSNLEWASASDNEKHAHRTGLKSGRGSQNSNAKLTAADVHAIRASTRNPSELAREFGVARSTIVNILKNKTWVHL